MNKMIKKAYAGAYAFYIWYIRRNYAKGDEDFENAVTRSDCFENRFRVCI